MRRLYVEGQREETVAALVSLTGEPQPLTAAMDEPLPAENVVEHFQRSALAGRKTAG